MVISVEVHLRPGEEREDALARATEAAVKDYRRAHGNTRRHLAIWRWNWDSTTLDGRYATYRGVLVGIHDRRTNSATIVAECWCSLYRV